MRSDDNDDRTLPGAKRGDGAARPTPSGSDHDEPLGDPTLPPSKASAPKPATNAPNCSAKAAWAPSTPCAIVRSKAAPSR
jgi:hypothetical protein